MNYLFNKKPKRSLKSSHQAILIPTNIAAGPLGFSTELGIGPKDKKNSRGPRIVLQDKSREDQGLPAPEASIPDVVVDDTEYGNELTVEDVGDSIEGEGEPAEVSTGRDWGSTVLGGGAILFDVARGAAESFGPLKAVLGVISVIYDNYEGTVAVRDKIQGLCTRITRLETFFREKTDDEAEKRRRIELLRKFKDIEVQLRYFSGKPGLRQFTDHVRDDEKVSGLLEDLREVISDYGMVQQMAIHEQGRKLMVQTNVITSKQDDAAEMSVLNNFRSAQGAEYRHGNRKGCLEGTRRAVINEIERWINDFDKPPVYWLNGLAGTGKTTIAQTISERTFAAGNLGASFFCSRDFEDRSSLDLIFPTLAVQLARRYTEVRSIFVPLVQSDPGIVRESLYNQMDKLIVRPLRESAISTVIVIDALDECKDEESTSAILSVLGQLVSQIPDVKFFLTGRPERRIREGFRLPLLSEATDVFVLHDVEPRQIDSDIRLFFRHKFSELVGGRGGLDGWPTREDLDHLCKRTAGLFVYAVATVKFVGDAACNPKLQLDLILRSSESSMYEGTTEFNSNTTLDSLYMAILQRAFIPSRPERDPSTRSILGAVILAANPLPPSAIAALLDIDPETVFLRLSSVQSLLVLQDVDFPVRPFHKSFPDFIVDPARCTNERFQISPSNHHPELLVGCLELMNRTLNKNMCKLPDVAANYEVEDLRERTKQYLDPALQYACKSWHKHLVDEHTICAPAVASALRHLLENKFLFWLEVLSILGATREAVDALKVAAKLMESSPTRDLIDDCFHFVTGFFEIINKSALHIYHSALPLSPQTSIVRRLYEPHTRPLVRVVRGLPVSWEQSVATMKFPTTVNAAVWSPCNRFIAIVYGSSRATIEILDAATLGQLATVDFPPDELCGPQWLIFSPGGRFLTWLSGNPGDFISLDVQTGALLSAISPEQQGGFLISVTYSTCGTMFGVSFRDDDIFAIRTYDILSGAHISSVLIEGEVLYEIWTHGECLRYGTIGSEVITVWEVEFTSTRTPTRVDSLSIPDNLRSSEYVWYHPAPSRLALTVQGRIFVWDTQNSKFLLDSVDPVDYIGGPHTSFSPDGHFFACGVVIPETYSPEISLWKESPTGYILHRKLVANTAAFTPLISPNGESIIAFGGSAVQLWHTTDSTTSPSVVSTQASQGGKSFILGFSPDEMSAAVARTEDKTVTILELKSGIPRLTIDTGMKVYGLRVGESTIVVVGEGRIITWNLPARDCVLDSRVNADDSIRATTFNHPPICIFTERPTISVSPSLRHIAIVELEDDEASHSHLHLYDVPTGQCLASVPINLGSSPWFTLDGREVWCLTVLDRGDRWKIVEDSESSVTKLEYLGPTTHPPDGFPWNSSRGYRVTIDNQKIFSPSGKLLLWLPPHLQSSKGQRMWAGRFLVSLHRGLPEPVILELE